MSILVIYRTFHKNDTIKLNVGSYVKVIGSVKTYDDIHFYIDCSEIEFVSKEETDDVFYKIEINFFDYESIKDYEKTTSE